jgi:putative phosphoribosyl transferase
MTGESAYRSLKGGDQGPLFADRRDAGRQLAKRLMPLRAQRPVILALPRGGVPVAHEIAVSLGAPLNVLAVRKLGAPENPEYGVGAVAEDGTVVINQQAVAGLGIRRGDLERIIAREAAELRRRVGRYRHGRPLIDLAGRTVIVVDDGVATGVTDAAALRAVRKRGPREVILAVPVCAPDAAEHLATEADEVVCLQAPAQLDGVGRWYGDFEQVSDEEVIALLGASNRPDQRARKLEVAITAGRAQLVGDLRLPPDPVGLVLFAHGSGSSRRSPRNIEVARRLEADGLGTLLFDLLTEEEARRRENVFDIPLLGERLVAATHWAMEEADLRTLPLGYFGASTGGAAALLAAAELPSEVAAVVVRGGRPDLAGTRLAAVRAPTLLIVGGRDTEVLALNRRAKARLGGPSQLAVVEGATHLFEEPGALELVAELASDWFATHLSMSARLAKASAGGGG